MSKRTNPHVAHGGRWINHPVTGERTFVCPCGHTFTPRSTP